MKFEKGSIRRSLRYSLADGLFTAMMVGVSESYLIPYGIALGASPSQVAFLAAIPMLVATIIQTQSARVTQVMGHRTKLINISVFFHAASWLLILAAPLLVLKTRFSSWAPWALLAAATIFTTIGAFSVPAWQSLMSDYIPVKKRGRYFGFRNRLQGFFTVTVSVIAGLLLNHYGKLSLKGFAWIFLFAMVCRFAAWACLLKMKEPFRKSSHDVYFSFWAFIKQFRTSNFAKFVIMVSMMSFAVNISGPLLAVFLLKDLGFSYAYYMIVVSTAALSGFAAQGFWGRMADRRGNITTFKVVGWGIALIPFLWIFSHHIAYLFFVQIVAGGFWGGFNLLTANFIMEAVSPEKRIRCFSYFNVVNSVAVLGGAALGGLLFHRLPAAFSYSFLTLFLLSCVCRISVMLFLAPRVQEIRPVYE